MSTTEIAVTLGGIAFMLPLSAFVAQHATRWIANFKPSYKRALISTAVAFAGCAFMSLIFRVATPSLHLGSMGFVVSLIIWTAAHVNLLRSESGEQLTTGKAVAVAFCQFIGTLIIWMIFAMVFALGYRGLNSVLKGL